MNTISKAKTLLAAERVDEARELLLENGFIERLDSEIQAAYEQLIPLSKALQEQLSGPLASLRSKQAATRSKAADQIGREARKEWSSDRKVWLADPRTTGPLIKALDDVDDKVVEVAAAAIAAIARGYFPDLRAFDPLAKLLSSPKKNVRLYAVLGISSLHHPDRWKLLLNMTTDKVTDVRRTVCRSMVAYLPKSKLSPALRAKLIAAITPLQSDPDGVVKKVAGNVLRLLETEKSDVV
jgi:HEAT repeat protein